MTGPSMRYGGLLEEQKGLIQTAQMHIVSLLTKVESERRTGLRQ